MHGSSKFQNDDTARSRHLRREGIAQLLADAGREPGPAAAAEASVSTLAAAGALLASAGART